MISITVEQKNILSEYFSDIDSLIANVDIQDFLDLINDEIINNMLGNDDEPDNEGIRLQRVYDQIYNQN